MTHSPAVPPDIASRFFNNYLNRLNKYSIPVKQTRWYMKRVEEYIKAHNGS